MRIEVIHPRELGQSERARWAALRAADPDLASPYLSSGFTIAVGAARADARVAIIEDGAAIQGFMPVQRPSPFSAMALGAPISDYQGLIAAPDLELDARKLCQALKVGRIDVYAVPRQQKLIQGRVYGVNDSFVARLGEGGSQAYLKELRAARSDTVKKMNRKRNQFAEREGGLEFAVGPASGAAFRQLMDWSRSKCRQSRQPPIWETPWVLATLDRLCDSDDPDCRAMLVTDVAGGRLAAVQLLLQSGPVLHTWIIGHECAFESYSPGMSLTRRSIEWAADNGFTEVDLGLGDYRFKRQLTNHVRHVAYGYLGDSSMAAAVRKLEYDVRRAVEGSAVAMVQRLPGKAMRRWDTHRALGLIPPRPNA